MTRIQSIARRTSEHPIKAMAGSAAVAAALAQGVPALIQYVSSRDEAADVRVDESYRAHLETLSVVLERSEAERARLIERNERLVEIIQECRVSGTVEIPESALEAVR